MRQRHTHTIEPEVALTDSELMERWAQQSGIDLQAPKETDGDTPPPNESAQEGLMVIPAVIGS